VETVPSKNPFLCLEASAKTNPSGVFVETVDQKVLNSEALVHVRKLAFELRHLGVRPGDVVALNVPDSLGALFLLAIFHEACASTVLPRGFVPSTAFTVDWLFTVSPNPDSAATRTVLVDGTFLQRVEENPYGISPRPYASDDSIIRISYSSGTTGTPKAVASRLGRLADVTAGALETWMEGDPFLVLFGLGMSAGFNGLCLSVLDGRPYLCVGASEIPAILDFAARKSVTSLKGSPAQMEALVDELEAEAKTLPDVRSIYVMGTVMPPPLAERLRRATDGCEIHTLYGSTEATIATAKHYDSADPHDAGYPLAGTELQIVDDADRAVPDGQVGRIRLRTPHMVPGYLGNPEATASTFRDGWFYPGDLGSIRADGGLTLAGRSSEILNAGGVKIDPVQLDLFAREHPGVRDAASFGFASSSGIQRIGIAVVVNDGFDVNALIADFRRRFGRAAPRLVARIDEVPRNAQGKPLRRVLADNYEGRESAVGAALPD
jgi:acyl-CoA synthetase (AMP-forming)/AMP-acid ligase II